MYVCKVDACFIMTNNNSIFLTPDFYLFLLFSWFTIWPMTLKWHLTFYIIHLCTVMILDDPELPEVIFDSYIYLVYSFDPKWPWIVKWPHIIYLCTIIILDDREVTFDSYIFPFYSHSLHPKWPGRVKWPRYLPLYYYYPEWPCNDIFDFYIIHRYYHDNEWPWSDIWILYYLPTILDKNGWDTCT